MAAYREHVTVSGLCGVGYGAMAAWGMGFTPVQGAIAGVLAWVGGMLPDLDSDSGRPIREIFSLLGAVVPLVMLRHLMHWGGGSDNTMLLAILVYIGVRYVAASVLSRVSVHRGMFHSIPALAIAAELTYLGYKSDVPTVKLLMAGGTALGFLSHLVLDELYSVQWTGVRLKLNKAAGSAMKMFSRELMPNVITYSLLFVLTYVTLIQAGLLKDPGAVPGPGALQRSQQAAEEFEFRR